VIAFCIVEDSVVTKCSQCAKIGRLHHTVPCLLILHCFALTFFRFVFSGVIYQVLIRVPCNVCPHAFVGAAPKGYKLAVKPTVSGIDNVLHV